jgi:hypothetical protein
LLKVRKKLHIDTRVGTAGELGLIFTDGDGTDLAACGWRVGPNGWGSR